MRVFFLSIGLTLVASAAWGQQSKAVDDAVLKNAGKTGTEWLTYGLTPGETRYSPLNQINAANVSRLGSGLVLRHRTKAAAVRKPRLWFGTAPSTASPIGAWFTRSTLAPARNAGAGIPR